MQLDLTFFHDDISYRPFPLAMKAISESIHSLFQYSTFVPPPREYPGVIVLSTPCPNEPIGPA